MRILHTSDWHLGHGLHGRSRETEHQRFIDWLLDRLDEHMVDALRRPLSEAQCSAAWSWPDGRLDGIGDSLVADRIQSDPAVPTTSDAGPTVLEAAR